MDFVMIQSVPHWLSMSLNMCLLTSRHPSFVSWFSGVSSTQGFVSFGIRVTHHVEYGLDHSMDCDYGCCLGKSYLGRATVDVGCGAWWFVTIPSVPHWLSMSFMSSQTPFPCKPVFRGEFYLEVRIIHRQLRGSRLLISLIQFVCFFMSR